jgi:hypothetical protein
VHICKLSVQEIATICYYFSLVTHAFSLSWQSVVFSLLFFPPQNVLSDEISPTTLEFGKCLCLGNDFRVQGYQFLKVVNISKVLFGTRSFVGISGDNPHLFLKICLVLEC